MKFTISCFVRVHSPAKQKELISWLRDVGYRIYHNGPNPNSVATDSSWGGAYLGRWAPLGKQNCGTDIELFKALAAMNPYNDREQWFVDDLGKWHKALLDTPVATFASIDENHIIHWARKATAEEIIEHFKNKQQ